MAKPLNLHKVQRTYSPDDIKQRLIEAEARERADSRTDAERWLGDPPAERSALAAKLSRAPQQRFIYNDPNIKPERGEPFDSDFNAPKKKLSRWEKYRQRRAVRF
jgi:hypothetical protein